MTKTLPRPQTKRARAANLDSFQNGSGHDVRAWYLDGRIYFRQKYARRT